MPRLVLASNSSTRLAVLIGAGIDPEVVVSGVSEDFDETLSTAAAVGVLAERKARAVAGHCRDALVLGCDSMLEFEGVALGKPTSPKDARDLWHRLSGARAELFTGHVLIDTRSGRSAARVASARVHFGVPSSAEIEAYVKSGEPIGMAGAFSIDGRGGAFVESIEGHPTTVLGLSLPVLRSLLGEVGIALTDLWRAAPEVGM